VLKHACEVSGNRAIVSLHVSRRPVKAIWRTKPAPYSWPGIFTDGRHTWTNYGMVQTTLKARLPGTSQRGAQHTDGHQVLAIYWLTRGCR
jgi:hypothetical protein